MVATEAKGLSRGLATLWDPMRIRAKACKCFAGIIISASIREKDFPINILNIYAPYKNRAPFWGNSFTSDMFDIEHLIITCDLNVTLNSNECWGHCRKNDSLADSIKLELLNKNLVDVAPGEMKPSTLR